MKKLIQTIYAYFFPDDSKIKIESSFDFHWDEKQLIVHYQFHTFRSLFWHHWGMAFVLPARRVKEIYEQQPVLVFASAAMFVYFFILNLKGLANVSNLMLIGGAIAYDSSNSGGSVVDGTSLTISITPTGTSRVMVAGISATVAATATFNSVSMTQVATKTFLYVNKIFRLVAPAASTQNLVFSFASSASAGGGVNFTGADQSTPDDGSVVGNGGDDIGDTVILNVTTAVNNTFLFAIMSGSTTNAVHTLTDRAGQTRRWLVDQLTGGTAGCHPGSTKPTTTAGSYSMGWTQASPDNGAWDMCMVGVRESAGTTYTPTYTETLTLTDSITRQITRVVTETLTLTDAIAKATVRILTETITLTDVFAGALTIARTYSESIGLTDTIKKFLNGSATFWNDITKTVSSWVDAVKNSSSWTDQDKN